MKKMKKTFVRTAHALSLMVVAAAMIAFVGCSKGGDDPVPPPGEPSELEVDPVTSYFTYPADTADIDVFATDPWTATVSSGATWCTVTPASGNGDGYISIAVTQNTNPTVGERSATVTLASGDVTATITVTQEVLQSTLCTKCLWNGSAWVDGYVTATNYPFDDPNTATGLPWRNDPADEWMNWVNQDVKSDKDGRANTAKITSFPGSAVQTCKDLGEGWYLPAYEELYNMTTATSSTPYGGLYGASPLNGLAGAGLIVYVVENENERRPYWSSTEADNHQGRHTGSQPNYPNGTAITIDDQGLSYCLFKTDAHLFQCVWRP
jgi:hypothetical protein